MTVRTSMANLITRTRTLIADPTGAVLDDQQVQDALDKWRTEQRQMMLQGMPSFRPGGTILYLEYYSDIGDWEDDVLLQDAAFNTLTPSLAELIPGHWTFATQPPGIAVRATGKTYDLHGAAADLLDSWAATVKLDFTVQTDRDQYQRDQKFTMITEMAMKQRALAMPRAGRITQSDQSPDHVGGGVVYPSFDQADSL